MQLGVAGRRGVSLLSRSGSNVSNIIGFRAYTNIRDAGGSFGKKEAAQEDKFIRDHDRELIEKLKKDLDSKPHPAAPETPAPRAAASSSSKPESEDPEKIHISPIDSGYGGAVRGGGGAFGKKEAAIEEKYFRDQDKEKLKELKKHQH